MLIRREYAPAKSPTSFSNGGGMAYGLRRSSSRIASALGRKPERDNFLASIGSLAGIDQRPGHQRIVLRHFLTGVFNPVRIDRRMPGIDRRYNVSSTARQSFSETRTAFCALPAIMIGRYERAVSAMSSSNFRLAIWAATVMEGLYHVGRQTKR